MALVAVLASAPRTARADDDRRTDQRLVARRHFDLGEALFKAGRYEEAVVEFHAAYSIDPRPELLVNMAQAARLHGDRDQALARYREFLGIAPGHQYAPSVRRIVEQLEAEIAREPPPSPPVPAPPPTPSPSPIARQPTTIRLDDQPRGSARLRRSGAAVAVAGMVTLGVGAGFAVRANRLDDLLSSHGGSWTDELLAKQGERTTARRVFYGTTALGAAAVVTGTVLYLMGRPDRSRPSVVIAPAHGGLAVAFEM